MIENRILRGIAKIVGIISRPLGLSQIPFLQDLYLNIAKITLPDKDIWVKMDDQDMLIPNPRKHVLGRMIYLHGTWEETVSRILCEEVRPGMTALDIGAYVGYYTLLLAKRVGKAGKVYAFEPNPDIRKFIEINVQRNGYSHVTIFPYALFSKEGYGILGGKDNLQAYLIPQTSKMEKAAEIVVFDQRKEVLGIDKVDLIKMDVEGAELDILYGMRDLLEKYHPILIIEVHVWGLVHFQHSDSRLREFIRSFGYTINDIWAHLDTITVLCKSAEPGLKPVREIDD